MIVAPPKFDVLKTNEAPLGVSGIQDIRGKITGIRDI